MISLPWRLQSPVGREPAIETSLTEREAACLQRLAAARTVLEVGAAYGFATVVMASKARYVITIDRHDAHRGSLEALRSNLRSHSRDRVVTVLVGDSLAVLPLLVAQFDLVFLDGSHRFAGLWADLQQAERLLAPGGQIAVHDYEEQSCPDVRPAVEASGIPGKVWVDTLWVSEPLSE